MVATFTGSGGAIVKVSPTGDTSDGDGALFVENNSSTKPAVVIETNQAQQGANDVLVRIEASSSSFPQPTLEIINKGTGGNAASIRMKGPSPQIEFVEDDQTAPAGKFELQVQGDIIRFTGRNSSDSSFEEIANFRRMDDPTYPGLFQHKGDYLSFRDATPQSKPTITGSRGGNAALQNLLTALADLGLITDSTT